MDDQLIITLKIGDLKNIINECISNALNQFSNKGEKEETLMKRIDVAKLFGISLVTLNQWMRDGRLLYHRIKSRVYFKKAEVMEALNLIKRYKRPE